MRGKDLKTYEANFEYLKTTTLLPKLEQIYNTKVNNFIDAYYFADTIICEDFEGDTSKSSKLTAQDWKTIAYIQ